MTIIAFVLFSGCFLIFGPVCINWLLTGATALTSTGSIKEWYLIALVVWQMFVFGRYRKVICNTKVSPAESQSTVRLRKRRVRKMVALTNSTIVFSLLLFALNKPIANANAGWSYLMKAYSDVFLTLRYVGYGCFVSIVFYYLVKYSRIEEKRNNTYRTTRRSKKVSPKAEKGIVRKAVPDDSMVMPFWDYDVFFKVDTARIKFR